MNKPRSPENQELGVDLGAPDVLWHSPPPWSVGGYSTQTRLVTESLVQSGYRVDLSGSLDHALFTHGPHRVWPSESLTAASLVLNARAAFRDSAERPKAIALTDAIRLGQADLSDVEVAWWVPFNHDPVPDQVLEVLAGGVDHVISLSRWGQNALARRDVGSRYIPHGVDTRIFTPGGQHSKADARALLGLPADAFIVGMVAANNEWVSNRKSFPEAFSAFSEFRAQHPDSVLYVHSSMDGDPGRGMDLRTLAQEIGLVDDALAFTHPELYRLGFDVEKLAALYRAFDVLLAPSAGEGFGIPVIEAQACGVPVIVSDFSAQPELVGDGWIVGGQRRWVPPVGSWQFTPSLGEIVDALTEAYNNGSGTSEKAANFARGYDHTALFESHWSPFLSNWLGTPAIGEQ